MNFKKLTKDQLITTIDQIQIENNKSLLQIMIERFKNYRILLLKLTFIAFTVRVIKKIFFI